MTQQGRLDSVTAATSRRLPASEMPLTPPLSQALCDVTLWSPVGTMPAQLRTETAPYQAIPTDASLALPGGEAPSAPLGS